MSAIRPLPHQTSAETGPCRPPICNHGCQAGSGVLESFFRNRRESRMTDTSSPPLTLAQRRDAALAVFARAAIDWAHAERDVARAGRLAAELRRLSTTLEHSMNIPTVAPGPTASG